jgi:hypothetical protein
MSGAMARLRRERAVFASERAGVGGAESSSGVEEASLAAFGAAPPSSEASWRGAGVARSWEALPKRSRVSVPDANKPRSRDPTPPARRGDASVAARAPPPAQHPRHAPPPPPGPLSGAITDLLDGFECAPRRMRATRTRLRATH